MLSTVKSANILGIFPIPHYSHYLFQESLVKVLLDRGHNITVISEFSFMRHENLTEIPLEKSEEMTKLIELKTTKRAVWKVMVNFFEVYMKQIKDKNVQKLINEGSNNHFDLVIMEQFAFHPFLGFAEFYDCPVILTTSTETSYLIHGMMGNEINPIIQPDRTLLSYSYEDMTMFQRIECVIMSAFLVVWQSIANYLAFTPHLKKLFPNMTQSAVEDRVALLMTNTNAAMGYARPSTNLIHIGFLQVKPEKPLLDSELKTFMDNSQSGVIYMSFGTMAKSSDMAPKMIQMFINVFAKLKLNVIWKFENDTMIRKPDNVFISGWVPQADLLAHPNMKLFITHGGMASIQEAIDRAVPMILFPLFFDQNFNSQLMQRKGVGISLDLNQVNEESLSSTIHEVLKPKYKKNIKILSELVYEDQTSSQEKVVWWVEHVIKHKGAEHLKYIGRKVPFYEKYCIDVLAILTLTIFTMLKISHLIRRLNKHPNLDDKKIS